jgi:hypothetical protein
MGLLSKFSDAVSGRGTLGEGLGVGGSVWRVWGETSGTASDFAGNWVFSAGGQRNVVTATGASAFSRGADVGDKTCGRGLGALWSSGGDPEG